MEARPHPRQQERLAALRRFEILDTPRETEFDDIVALVAQICDAPVAVINFIDSDRQWFKAEVGLGVRSTPLETSLCSHVILEHEFVEIEDTLADPRMCDNPLCTSENGFRFYAGALMKSPEGLPLGTLCVLDTRVRTLTDLQRRTIQTLADRVMSELNLRLALRVQDVLRGEIDHRVKNSLASIGAIIHLQAARATSEEVREALMAVQSRLNAMSAFHEEMQMVGEDPVDARLLITRSVDKLKQLIGEEVTFELDLESVGLPSDHASAVAMIVNEFATNSARHAFQPGADAAIAIAVRRTGGGYRLTCRDNGSGGDLALDRIANQSGLGTRVIGALGSSLGGKTLWSAAGGGIQLDLSVKLPSAI